MIHAPRWSLHVRGRGGCDGRRELIELIDSDAFWWGCTRCMCDLYLTAMWIGKDVFAYAWVP